MNEVNKEMTQALLGELLEEEVKLSNADREYKAAKIRFDVASHKYAVVRDMVTEQLGFSPYLIPPAAWPSEALHHLSEHGKYKFIHMKTGYAVISALKEKSEPLTFEQIVEQLKSGGFGYPVKMLNRMVNAALMKTTGVEKTEDEKYVYKELNEEDMQF